VVCARQEVGTHCTSGCPRVSVGPVAVFESCELAPRFDRTVVPKVVFDRDEAHSLAITLFPLVEAKRDAAKSAPNALSMKPGCLKISKQSELSLTTCEASMGNAIAHG